MRLRFTAGGRGHDVEVTPLGGGAFRLSVDGAVFEVRAERRADAIDLMTHDGLVRAWVSRDGPLRFVSAPGIGDLVLRREQGRGARRSEEGAADPASPMPGRVVQVLVAPGDEVAPGQPLVVVEAMKTELTIAAPRAARVARLAVGPGERCEAGQTLIELEAP